MIYIPDRRKTEPKPVKLSEGVDASILAASSTWGFANFDNQDPEPPPASRPQVAFSRALPDSDVLRRGLSGAKSKMGHHEPE